MVTEKKLLPSGAENAVSLLERGESSTSSKTSPRHKTNSKGSKIPPQNTAEKARKNTPVL